MANAALPRVVGGARALLDEQIEYRDLLVQMTRRDLLIRYKQTAMGFGWAICVPLVNTIVFSLLFTRVAAIDTGMPYPIYVYSGMVAWNFFASSLRFAVTSLTSNANLVSKVYFPREILPFSAILVALVDAAVAALLLLAMLVYWGITPDWHIVLVLPLVAIQVALTAGAALLLAMANLYFRDVKYVLDILLSVGMFAASVVYPIGAVGGRLGRALALNPLSILLDAYRAVIVARVVPDAAPLALAALAAAALLAVGWATFHRAELQFAEHI